MLAAAIDGDAIDLLGRLLPPACEPGRRRPLMNGDQLMAGFGLASRPADRPAAGRAARGAGGGRGGDVEAARLGWLSGTDRNRRDGMLNVDIAVAKAAKYAVRESGDSVEVVERPRGGISVIMADGQRSGQSAKAISNIAVRKAMSLLSEGVRDGAVARAAHDYLRTQRRGQVSAELIIVSVDLETRTLVISRNSQCPVLLREAGSAGAPLMTPRRRSASGIARGRSSSSWRWRPGRSRWRTPTASCTRGNAAGRQLDPLAVVAELSGRPTCSAQSLADSLLAAACGRRRWPPRR